MKASNSKILLYLKRSSSKVFIVAGIILIVSIYHDHYYSKIFFNFPSKGKVAKVINEKGTITFVSGTKLKLENNYSSSETIKRTGSIVSVDGTIDGEFDPQLAPLIKLKKYSIEINVSEIDLSCSEKFVMQYPSFLRRFVYYIPKSPLFDGQKWQISSCEGRFTCNYDLKLKEKKGNVEMLCSGNIGSADIAMSGNLKINSRFNGFSSVMLDIVSESPEMVSSWQFLETAEIK